MQYLKKFKLKIGTFLLMLILTILCIIGCAYFSYYLNIYEEQLKITPKYNLVALKTIKDIFVVISSIFGTNLLLSILIDIRSKNQIVTDIIENDVISSPEFYNKMDDEKKIKMLNALEKHLYYKNMNVQEIFNEIRKKLNNKIKDYYYESCKYIVSCCIYDTYIEKEIIREVTIKSYDKKYQAKEFCIGRFSSKEVDGKKSYELKSLKINDEQTDLDNDIELVPCEILGLEEQNEYNISYRIIYKKPIMFYNDNDHNTTLVVKCLTRTTIDDKCSTFRVAKPCKNFALDYTLQQQTKHRLTVDAFGFLDDAKKSLNNNSKNNVHITFDNWIFENDGVVVTILDKSN